MQYSLKSMVALSQLLAYIKKEQNFHCDVHRLCLITEYGHYKTYNLGRKMECACLILILRVVFTHFIKTFFFFFALEAVAVLNMDIT